LEESKGNLHFLIQKDAKEAKDILITLVYCNQRVTTEDATDRLLGACWAYDSCMFWISCGVKWHPFLADKQGFLGAEQSMNFIGFAFLRIVGGIFSLFSCDRGS
jgi:hypothetical protein